MMEQVALTIGMPVFNDKDFITQTLESVLRQTYNDFILIISDDCSTDGSGEICKAFARNDSRIKYIRQKTNLGISWNMQFLLSLCKTEFFMWAGDDDLYAPTFIEGHIAALQSNPGSVSAFCPCVLIDENNQQLSESILIDYGNPNTFKRLLYYIKNSTDYFGYGVFRTDAIKDVHFPVWWWPNRNTPYNNIYPTLCYYLAKGDFIFVNKGVMFFKRVKSEKKTHHLLVGKNNAVKESFAFWVRKLNLWYFTQKLLFNALGLKLTLRLSPFLLWFWTIRPSWAQFNLAFTSFFRNRLKVN